MDTFYMDGCKQQPEFIFLDKIFIPAMELIDLDYKLQEELEYHLLAEENLEDNIDDYNCDTTGLKNSFSEIIGFINIQQDSLKELEVYDGNVNLYNAAIKLFSVFKKELDTAIPELISIIESEEMNDEITKKLNNYYPQLQINLDTALNSFYFHLEEYANKYDISLESGQTHT